MSRFSQILGVQNLYYSNPPQICRFLSSNLYDFVDVIDLNLK